MSFKSLFNRIRGRKAPKHSSPIAHLETQVKRAKEFERLLYSAVKLGSRVTMRIQVEGARYDAGVTLFPEDPMIEILTNFASGARLSYQGRLEDAEAYAYGNAKAANWDDFREGAGWCDKADGMPI